MGGELELPEPIIQRIQYFLDTREAARTAILSKSWCSAWLTHPKIDLDEIRYRKGKPSTVNFPVFVKKTIQRYEESKLNIDSFSLRICGSPLDVKEMVVKALEMGATHLVLIYLSTLMDLHLPNEVFAAENLIGLSVEGFRIDLGPYPNVRCSRLQSLNLCRLKGKCISSSLSYIISHCHLIKDLSLSKVYADDEQDNLDCYFGDRLEFPKLYNITRMVLSRVELYIWFLGDLSSMFPLLKDLDLDLQYSSITYQQDRRVSSRSLEVLSFAVPCQNLRIEFDVPISSLCFEPTLREWEAHLFTSCERLSTSWFLELSKWGTQLSQSKLHLSCNIRSDQGFDYEVEELQSLPKIQVENLTLDTLKVPSSNCFALFDGLFRTCHPKFITQQLFPTRVIGWKTNNTFLCKMLVQHINEKCIGMHSLHDLKQVYWQIFDEVIAEWRDTPLNSLLDASASPKHEQKIRFRLEWRGVA